jgi:Cu-Zn family superoxide dismutase
MSARTIAWILPIAALAACEPQPSEMVVNNDAIVPAAAESATLLDSAGKAIGAVEISEGAEGVTLRLSATGLPPGTHGVHLHEAGRCDGPAFESAGEHWNPAKRQHGHENPKGAHLGDLTNAEVPENGEAATSYVVAGATMRGGTNPLADADGTSLIIHAQADDYKTDPSGNSGGRIACAVVGVPAGR